MRGNSQAGKNGQKRQGVVADTKEVHSMHSMDIYGKTEKRQTGRQETIDEVYQRACE